MSTEDLPPKAEEQRKDIAKFLENASYEILGGNRKYKDTHIMVLPLLKTLGLEVRKHYPRIGNQTETS